MCGNNDRKRRGRYVQKIAICGQAICAGNTLLFHDFAPSCSNLMVLMEENASLLRKTR